jgi:hypothetical protein
MQPTLQAARRSSTHVSFAVNSAWACFIKHSLRLLVGKGEAVASALPYTSTLQ